MKKDGPRGFVWFPQDYFGDVLLRLMPGDLRIFWVEALFLMAESPRRGVLLQKNGKSYSQADLATAMNLSPETVERAHRYVLEKGIASLDRQSRALMNRKMVRAEMQRKVNEKNAKLGGNPALKPKTHATSNLPLIDAHIKDLPVSDNHEDNWPDNHADNSRARVPDPDPDPDPVLPRPVHNSLNIDSPPKKRGGRHDPAAEMFKAKYLENIGNPYEWRPGDFPQIDKLRKRLKLASDQTPDGWDSGLDNYFASPLAEFSLQYFASKYDTFKNSQLDRFKIPVNHRGNGNGQRESSQDRAVRENKETAERLHRLFGDTTGDGPGPEDPGGTDLALRGRPK